MIQPIPGNRPSLDINININGADDLKGLLMQLLSRATFSAHDLDGINLTTTQVTSAQPGGLPGPEPEVVCPLPRSGSRYSGSPPMTMVEAYQRLCEPRDELRGLKTSSRKECTNAVRQFENWLVGELLPVHRSDTPVTTVQDCDIWQAIEDDSMVLRKFRSCEIAAGNAERTAMKKLATIKKLLRCCVENGLLSRMPESPESQGEENDLSETVTLEEMRLIRDAAASATWPVIEGVTPADYWLFAIDACWTYGPRLLDLFSYKSEKTGLLWSHVTLSPACPAPQLKNFEHQAGWMWFPIGKQSRKKRMLLLPLSVRIREHLDRWHARAVACEESGPACRVVPLPFGRTHNWHWRKILNRAGVDARIRLSEGRSIPSFRKGCAVHWEKQSGELADYVLGHRGKSMRSRHYGQAVKLVAEAIERVPF